MIYSFTYDTKIGPITFSELEGRIFQLVFSKDKVADKHIIQETPLIGDAHKQLMEYLSGSRKKFSLPLNPIGSKFQRSVWNALLSIPYGETYSYKDISILIDNPKAYRAVGMANNKNPISIIIPCHRVIGSNGKLVGYGGGLHIKKHLLELERSNLK